MVKGNNISSIQAQNQLAQAQQTILHLQNAIGQAQSHPNDTIVQEIKSTMERAEQSLSQAEQVTDNPGAIDLARRDLENQKQAFQEVKDNLE